MISILLKTNESERMFFRIPNIEAVKPAEFIAVQASVESYCQLCLPWNFAIRLMKNMYKKHMKEKKSNAQESVKY